MRTPISHPRRIAGLGMLAALLTLSACGDDAGDSATGPPAEIEGGEVDAVARYSRDHGLSGLSPASLTLVAAIESDARRTIKVEVAETGSRFVPDEHFVDAAGVPTRGNYFVTDGYLYRRGTLSCVDGVCDGVVYDDEGNPSPEFPGRLIGTWTCYGTHTADAATTTTGPLVVTTQVYDFGDTVGEQMVVTNGFELADVGVPVDRAIVGGTGRHANRGGTQTQTLLGLNNPDLVIDGVPLFGVSLSVELETR